MTEVEAVGVETDPIEEVLDDVRAGAFVVLLGGLQSELLGCVLLAAEHANPSRLGAMARDGLGLMYLCLDDARCEELGLRPLAQPGDDERWQSRLTVSISHRDAPIDNALEGRAATIRRACDPTVGRDQFIEPGDVFPMRARPDGVLRRSGHAEAAVDLARLAGLAPAGVVAPVVDDEGTAARTSGLVTYARERALKLVTIGDVVRHRLRTDRLVERGTSVRLPTTAGDFTITDFVEVVTGKHHVALVKGEVSGQEDVLVRVHTGCFLGDVLHSGACACGEVLHKALERLDAEGRGVLVYLIGDRRMGAICPNSPAARQGALETQEYGTGSQILAELGLSTIRILTNHPKQIVGIEGFGLEVTGTIPVDD